MKRISRSFRYCCIVFLCLLLVCQLFVDGAKPTLASPGTLLWDIVDTPANGLESNIIANPSEINTFVIGPDDRTFYAVDVSNSTIYKTTDAGVTWLRGNTITTNLSTAGAKLPTWNIAVAPDDVNFLVAVTDGNGLPLPGGPKNVFVSSDGGQNWDNAQLPSLNANEFISCVAVSMLYDGSNRYIAVATRSVAGGGRVFTRRGPGLSGWGNQSAAPSINWKSGDVVALKFSPTYAADATIVIAIAAADGFFVNMGTHDTRDNWTAWRSGLGFPVKIVSTPDNRSPTNAQIITADLELPSDFSGADPGLLRRCWVSFDASTGAAYFSGVYRVDSTVPYQLKYTTVTIPATPERRISSIAYSGSYASGRLLAGETTTVQNSTPPRCTVDIWLCQDPTSITSAYNWKLFDPLKSPTGGVTGGTAGRANAMVAWSTGGSRMYCGTGSANLSLPGTLAAIPSTAWPGGLWSSSIANDESAFSVSRDGGTTWNQLSLIDTEVTFLADIAAFEPTEDSEQTNVLYLASINDIAGPDTRFDSIWRSTSEPLGLNWERILCTLATNNDSILRGNPRILKEVDRSKVIALADRGTDIMYYSDDEGQNWQRLYHGYQTTDFTLANDSLIYILCNDTYVLRGTKGTAWQWGTKLFTGLTSAHTITTPLKNPPKKAGVQTGLETAAEDWVIVGSELVGEVAYADFSKVIVKFEPSIDLQKRLPAPGDVHVIADERFDINYTFYAATGGVGGDAGKIYRWVIGKNTEWDELKPINSDFRGLEQRQGALYGVFDIFSVPHAGVDRTLYPLKAVPPPPEWDDLTASFNPNVYNFVVFTREPAALKLSTRIDNSLWAIDNRPFNWGTKQGCLWNYADTLAKNGPWNTAPASDDVVAVDPVTGRANEINFAWRSLSLANGYELQIAKDQDFFMRVLVNENIVPPIQLAPGWILQPGFLDASHKYFWRVRARRATTGEIISSPWSATLYFTVMAGFPVQAKNMGPTLLKPVNNCIIRASSPAFSWSPMFQTTSYQFLLARDAAFTQVVVEAVTDTTAYAYKGNLEKGTYYWRVKAIKPMLSESSPVGSFTVADVEQPALVLGIEVSESISIFIWIGIALYGAFAILVLAWIMKTRYRNRR